MSERMPTRSTNLNVTRLDDEVLVLDLASKEIHCLNADAGRVFDACDGETEVDAVVETLRREAGRTDAERLVYAALATFESKGLLASLPAGATRRSFLQRSGLAAAAAAAALVTSIAAPSPAQAVSDRRRRR